jgi:hypothetical protein
MKLARSKSSRPASAALLSELRDVAQALRSATVDGSSVILTNVGLRYIQEIGSLLIRISNGENARLLFRQDKRTKPTRERDHKNMALAYWAEFAIDLNQSAAMKAARTILPRASDRRILDLKGKYRRQALARLNLAGRPVAYVIGDGVEIAAPSKRQYASLIKYLRKKSARRSPANT